MQKKHNIRKPEGKKMVKAHIHSHPRSTTQLSKVVPIGRGHKLQCAVSMLSNNMVRTEVKGQQPVISFDDEMMSMASSLVDINTIYRFRLTNSANATTTGGGILTGYQNADPSGGSGSTWTATEWSSLTSLFSEVRCTKFSLHFGRIAGLTQGNPIYISGVLSTVGANPTSTNQVWDNADAQIWNCASETSVHPIKHTIVQSDVAFAIVTTPNPGSYAGCPGAIQYYGDGFSTSTVVTKIAIEGFYEFRSRI
jgi:hypothetical protein